jgi:hypothetical protein
MSEEQSAGISQWEPKPGEYVRMKGREGIYIVLEVLVIPRLVRVRPLTALRSLGPFDFSEFIPITPVHDDGDDE